MRWSGANPQPSRDLKSNPPELRSLRTERLLLRSFCQDDLADVLRWESASNDTAQTFLNFCFQEYEKAAPGPWAIVLNEFGAVVGNCGFPHIDLQRRIAEINCYMAPQFRCQGLATEALQALLQFGFAELGLIRIEGRFVSDNTISEQLVRSLGMTFERMIRSDTTEEKLFAIARSASQAPSG